MGEHGFSIISCIKKDESPSYSFYWLKREYTWVWRNGSWQLSNEVYDDGTSCSVEDITVVRWWIQQLHQQSVVPVG